MRTFKKILIGSVLAVPVLMVLFFLTPVFYLVGHMVEWGIYFAINYIADVFHWLAWAVRFLLFQSEALVNSFMPSFDSFFGASREAKIALGFATCISFLACLKLLLGKGGSRE